jgi:hypothetical protein
LIATHVVAAAVSQARVATDLVRMVRLAAHATTDHLAARAVNSMTNANH